MELDAAWRTDREQALRAYSEYLGLEHLGRS